MFFELSKTKSKPSRLINSKIMQHINIDFCCLFLKQYYNCLVNTTVVAISQQNHDCNSHQLCPVPFVLMFCVNKVDLKMDPLTYWLNRRHVGLFFVLKLRAERVNVILLCSGWSLTDVVQLAALLCRSRHSESTRTQDLAIVLAPGAHLDTTWGGTCSLRITGLQPQQTD